MFIKRAGECTKIRNGILIPSDSPHATLQSQWRGDTPSSYLLPYFWRLYSQSQPQAQSSHNTPVSTMTRHTCSGDNRTFSTMTHLYS